MTPETRLLSNRLRRLIARRPDDVIRTDGGDETEHLTLAALQTLVERLETLESRIPTASQLEFLTARMEDQRWQLETWRRLSKWGACAVAVLGAFSLIQSINWKPIEAFRNFIGR